MVGPRAEVEVWNPYSVLRRSHRWSVVTSDHDAVKSAWRSDDGDGGNNGIVETQEEVEMSRSSLDFHSTYRPRPSSISISWDYSLISSFPLRYQACESNQRILFIFSSQVSYSESHPHSL